MAHSFELVANQVMAEQMAYAALPYRNLAALALNEGLHDEQSRLLTRSNVMANKAGKAYVRAIENGLISDPELAYDLAALEDDYRDLELDPCISDAELGYDRAIYDDEVATLKQTYKNSLYEKVYLPKNKDSPRLNDEQVDVMAIDIEALPQQMITKNDLISFVTASGRATNTAGRLWNQLRRMVEMRQQKPELFPEDMPWLRYQASSDQNSGARFDWLKDKLDVESLYQFLEWLDKRADNPAILKAVEVGARGQAVLKAYLSQLMDRPH